MTATLKGILGFGLFVIIFLVGYQYYMVWGQLQEAKDEANRLKDKVETTRVDLTVKIDALKAKETEYLTIIAAKEVKITQHLDKIAQLDEDLKKDRARTLKMSNEQDIADLFKKTYLFKDNAIVVLERPKINSISGEVLTNRQQKPITEPVLVVPIDYIKEMVDAKISLVVCEEQKGLQAKIIELEQEKSDLTQKIVQLNKEKATKFAEAYEEAYASFKTIHENYVSLLNSPPKVDLAPKWLQIVGGLIGGVVLCGI